MSTLYFNSDHEWARIDGDTAVVGISDYAQEALGEVVFVDLPELGREIAKSDEAVVVESVKAASEIYSPLSGTIIAVNGRLEQEPGLINADPMGEGWLFKIDVTEPSETASLMDEAAYRDYVSGLD